jgi:hypothetical protein
VFAAPVAISAAATPSAVANTPIRLPAPPPRFNHANIEAHRLSAPPRFRE